jgi:lysozyme
MSGSAQAGTTVVSQNAIQMATRLISQEEGTVLSPYQDVGGVWTIGIGTTRIDGQAVTANTPPISRAEALSLLASNLAARVAALEGMLTVVANDSQCCALLDFMYNEGNEALQGSTLLQNFNAGNVSGAASEFLVWDVANDQFSQGLLNRRKLEQAIFLGNATI